MTLSLRNQNHRLLLLIAAFLLTTGLCTIFPNLLTPGSVTNGIAALMFGIIGAMLYEFLHYDKSPSPRATVHIVSDDLQVSKCNSYRDKANRALLIWCLSLTYEILVIMFLPACLASFDISGTPDYLPGYVLIVIILGIPVFFLIMIWSEYQYKRALKRLDPVWTENWKSLGRAGGPLFLTALLIGIYFAFLGLLLGGAIGPIITPFLPPSVSPIFNPILTSATLTLSVTPTIIFRTFRRRDRVTITDISIHRPADQGAGSAPRSR